MRAIKKGDHSIPVIIQGFLLIERIRKGIGICELRFCVFFVILEGKLSSCLFAINQGA